MPLPPGPTSVPVPSVALVVLDGFGLAPDGPGNAISQANTPVFDELWATYPHTTLSTSGRDVGLPDGQMGNSEVGHLNLGAGAIVKQDLARIDDAIADGSFFENPALRAACGSARESRRGRLHADRPDLRRRRPLGLGAHRGGDRARRRGGGLRRSSSTPSPTGATPCRRRRRLRRGGRALAAPRRLGSARSAAATGGWTATAAGTGPSAPTTRSSTRGRRGRRAPSQAIRDVLRARRSPTSSSSPTVIGDYDGAEPRRAVHLHQLPARPGPAADPGAGRAGLRRVRPRRRRPVRGDDDDRVPARLALPGRLPAARAGDHARPGDRRGRASASCTSPRPRSTRTSPTSSTAAARRSGAGRSATSSTHPATSPPTTTSREMSAAAAAEAFTEHWREDGYRFGIINFANPDMVGHTGVIPAAVAAVEEVGHPPRRGRRGRPREGRGADRHRRPRQLRADARARRLAEHRPLDQSRPA